MLTAFLLLFVAQADATPISSLRTTRAYSLYVSPAGDDKRTCRLASMPCRTPAAALRRIPKQVDHRVIVVVGAGVYDGGLGVLADHDFGAVDPLNPGQVLIQCEQRAAVLDGGTATGTFSTVSNGAGTTWASYTDSSQTWVPSAMVDGGTVVGVGENVGFWLALTSGPGADGGMRLPVIDNSGTVLQVPGQFPSAPSTATAYQLQQPAVTFTGTAGTTQTPGAVTGTSLRVTYPAQLILRNNYSGFDSNQTTGAVNGGSWSPVIVRGCRFRGPEYSAATMAGITVDGPVAVEECRFDGWGSGGRMIVPTTSRAEVNFARNSVDSASARVMTFARPGTLWPSIAIEQNIIINADYVIFGPFFPAGFLSHNNLFQTVGMVAVSGAVYRVTEIADGYSFGDRVLRAATFFRVPGGGYEQVGGRGQFHIDGITATNIAGAFVNLSGRGGLSVTIGSANGPYGAANSSIEIAAGARFAVLAGAGTDFRWRNSTTTITEDAGSSTLASSILFNDNISGYPVSSVATATPHEICNARQTCAGWIDDSNPPYAPVLGWVGGGSGGQSLAVLPFSGSTSGGGTLAISFTPAFRDVPFCAADYAVDPGVLAPPLWQSATDGGVTWTGAASTAVRGLCVGPRTSP